MVDSIRTLLKPLVVVRPQEFAAFLWSFAWFFCLLFAYYILRPIRETMAASVASDYLFWLFLAVFIVMFLAVPAYSYLVARYGRRQFVPIVYRFFAAWLIFFSFAVSRASQPSFGLGCVYFVWVSVFNLFVVSVFWSVLVDSFGSGAAKRLFGFIAAGGSLGGLCSSLAVGQVAGQVGLPILLLMPIVILEVALFCFRRLDAQSEQLAQSTTEGESGVDGHQDEPTGGSVWEGLTQAFSSPYLFGICLFLLLGKFCATTVYLKQIEIVNAQVESQERRTELFANENSAVQILTLVFQAGLTGYLLRFCGLSITLALLPTVMIAALIYLSGTPTLLSVFVIQIIQRGLAYGVAEPARAVLFTVVSREDKYKTKSFIDTVIFRGGDVAASSLEKVLANAAKVMIPVTIVWAVLSWLLGEQQRRLARQLAAQKSQVAGRGS